MRLIKAGTSGFGLVMALLAAAVPMAALGAPAIPKADPIVLVEAPAGEFCKFPIEITALDGTRLHDGHGVVLATGPFTITVTNLATGDAETFNASGPTRLDRSTGALVLTGPALIGQPASRNVGPPFLIINRGRTVFSADNTIASTTGNTIDVCAAVA
jgi:hypothetical protein